LYKKEHFSNTIYNEYVYNILDKHKLLFQYPARTEEICHIQNKNNNNYLGIPWATLIDKQMIPTIKKDISKFNNLNRSYISVCQHISYKKIIPIAKLLNINVLYISHKEKNLNTINGITLKPMPIYAVNFEENDKNQLFKNKDFLKIKRELLFSFIGAIYLPVYISNIRKNIYENRDNYKSKNIIEDTKIWHYENIVYKEQVQNIKLDKSSHDEENIKTLNFNKVILNSRFSLCPSGSGPNTIRFWESLACGSIPVLLADTLELPHHELWKDTIVIIKEKDYKNIENILLSISLEKEKQMRENCIKVYKDFKNKFIRY